MKQSDVFSQLNHTFYIMQNDADVVFLGTKERKFHSDLCLNKFRRKEFIQEQKW